MNTSDAPARRDLDRDEAEYRVGRLQRRLAEGVTAELGLHVEFGGSAVLVTASVPSEACRDELLNLIRAELAGLPVHVAISVVETGPPDHAERVS